MSRQVRVLGGIGALFALVVGAALFLVLSDPEAPQADDPSADAGAEVVADDEASPKDEQAGGRRRAVRQGGAIIFGEVRRDGGETPVADQVVRMTGESDLLIEAKTDTKGQFRLEGIPEGGPYTVEVESAGFATVRLPGIALDRKEERDVGTLLLDAAVTVEIHARTLADAPLAGADVLAFAAPEMGPGFDWSKAMAQMGQEPVPVARVTTDAQGNATFADLAAGTWTFLAQKDGYARSGKAGRRLRAREEVKPVTLYLGKGYRLAGKVTDGEGAPIPGALVMAGQDANAWNIAAAPLRARALTAEDGSYAIDGLGAGDMSIMAAPPEAVPAQVDRIRIPDVPEFDIVLRKGGVLTGLVTMKDSEEPIEGATVRAWAWGMSGGRSAEATTDAEGRYTIEDLPEGNVNNVAVTKEGLVQVVEQMRGGSAFRKGVVVERDVEMTTGAKLEGTISGPDGPVSGATVMIMYEQQAGNFNNKNVKTDAQGKYTIDALPEGRVLVNASAEGLHTPDFPANWWMAMQGNSAPEHLTGKVVAGETLVLDLTLVGGTPISGRVEDAEGSPIEGARVIASVQNGWGWNGHNSNVVTGKDGRFTIQGLPAPTQITLTATKEGWGALPVDAIQVKAGEPATDAVVVMQAYPMVRGTVTSKSGELPPDTYVKIVGMPDVGNGRMFNPNMFAQNAGVHPVRPDGSFEAHVPLVKGNFVVRAEAPGVPAGNSERTKLVEGQTEYEVDVELGEGFSLTGRVADEMTNDGVAGARVRVSAGGGHANHMAEEVMVLDGAISSSVGWGGGGGSGAVIAITDAEGNFTVTGLPRGEHNVQAQAEGYVQGTAKASSPGTTSLRVALEPEMELAGVVVMSDGTPVEGVNVNARTTEQNPANGAGAGGSSMTDDKGRFEISKLRRGQYTLIVENGWQGRANVQFYTSPPTPAGNLDLRLVVQAGLKIAGRVVDSDGEGIPSVWINANPQDAKKGGRHMNAQSKPDGTFELVGLSADAGEYMLNFNANRFGGGGSLTPKQVKDVRPGTEGLKVVMEAGLSISGTVKMPDGMTFQNAWIQAMQLKEDGTPGGGGNGNSPVEASGKFNVGGLKAGRYRLQMMMWGNGTQKQMILEGGQDVAAGAEGLTLSASEGASIQGAVIDEGGKALAGANVRANPEGGGRALWANTDENGEFTITGLEDGKNYTLSVRMGGKIATSQKGVAAGASGLQFTLRSGVRTSGTVTDASGNALANTFVFLKPVDRNDLSQVNARTDDEGSFNAAGTEQGVTYAVTARYNDGEGWKQKEAGTVKGGDTGVSLQLAE